MKLSLSLTIKVWLLLAANLALLAALGLGWFFVRSESGWEQLSVGPLGDRVEALSDAIAERLWNAEPDDAEDILAQASQEHGAQFLWVRNDGLLLAGPSLPLPEAVRRELRPGDPERRPPPPRRDDRPDFEDRDGPPPPRDARAQGPAGRFLVRSSDGYWFGVRLHPSSEVVARRPPPRTTLLIHTLTPWSFARLLGLHHWLGLAGVALGVTALLWLPFLLGLTRRLRQLTAVTGQIAEGRFDARPATRGSDEVGQLADAIGRMATRLEAHTQEQKRFLGDVAHELGSPICRLQLAIELLEQRANADTLEAIQDAREEVRHMADLVGELLAFTRAGLRPRDAELSVLPLARLVNEAIEREGGTGAVCVDVDPSLKVLADEKLFSRAVGNLVRNALRHADGAGVSVRAHAKSEDHVELAVEDNGPGVPAEALQRLGEPFFRPELARTRESGGVGLGLTIVRSAVNACGGEVRFANREPHGFSAVMTLHVG